MRLNKHKLARIISVLLVPPSFTLILFTIFALTLETDYLKILITILTAFILGFLSQIILFIIFRKRGKIIDLDASDRGERTFPFVISAGFYFLGLIVLIIFNVHIFSIAFWFCYISNTIAVIFINRYWKISVHSMGAAGPVAAGFYLFGQTALIFLLIVILVGWSRIKLKVHNYAQVLAGTFLGFISTYLQMFFIIIWFK